MITVATWVCSIGSLVLSGLTIRNVLRVNRATEALRALREGGSDA